MTDAPLEVVRVLVVDDDADDRMLARDLLEESGRVYEVTDVETFEQALVELCSGRHDIALLDYRLGGRTGLDLLVAAREAGALTPGILLTGVGDPEVDQRALEAGALDFLVKSRMDSTALDRSIRYAVTTDRAMRELSDWKRRYTGAVRAARLVLVEWSPDLERISVGADVVDLLGLPPGHFESGAERWAERVHPDDLPSLRGELRRVLAEGGRLRVEYRIRRGDGVYVDVRHEGERVGATPAEAVVTGFVADITEQRRIGEQLLQAQKMDAVGRLAGGIAHDFNTVLTSILSYADLAAGAAGHDPQLRDDLQEIQRTARRGAALTRRLLAFSRSDPVRPDWVDASSLMVELKKMLARLIGSNIRLVTELDPHPPWIYADPGQIEQVVLNLALNARDAMPGGGRLGISTRAEDPGGGAEPCLVLAVDDEGCGMDAEVKSRLFQPFFTTKQPGLGTGLGLTIVHGIVKGLGGSIRVESAPGKGSRFEVVIPARPDAAAPPRGAELEPAAPAGSETVLVLEDDPGLRGLVRRILQRAGYRVVEAEDSRDAIRLARTGTPPLHLLVTDLAMPDMSGATVARRIRESFRGLPVLFISGLSDAPRWIGDLDRASLLAKPFSPADLAVAVRTILDGQLPAAGPGADSGAS